MNRAGTTFQFDDVLVDPEAFRVSKAGRVLPLEPKAIRVLVYLAENRPRAVSKDELMTAVWEDAAVTDNALTRIVAQLRKSLGDSSREPKYIETVPTLGYRFIAEVREPDVVAANLEPQAPVSAPVSPATFLGPRGRWIAGCLLAVAATLIWLVTRSSPKPRLARTTQFTTSEGLDTDPTFSPDGGAIAYTSDRTGSFEIYVRQLGLGGREIRITSDGGQNVQPAWSPDGRNIAYTSVVRRGIFIAPALGGPPQRLTSFGATPDWSRDGSSIAFRGEGVYSMSPNDSMPSSASAIWVVPASGGEPRLVAPARRVPGRQTRPRFAPDGRIFFLSYTEQFIAEVWSCDPAVGEPARVPVNLHFIHDYQVARDGRHLFVSATSQTGEAGLWRAAIDRRESVELLHTSPAHPGRVAISLDGAHIAYTTASLRSNIWRLPLTAEGAPAGEPQPITRDVDQRNGLPVISPDGRHLAWYVHRLGAYGKVWVADLDGSSAFPLTSDPANDSVASWLPDSRSIAVAKTGGKIELWSIALADRSRRLLASVALLPGAPPLLMPRLSPDGSQVVLHARPNGVFNLWKASLGSPALLQLTFDREGAAFPAWSPDGRWIAFQLNRGEDTHVAIVTSRGGDPVEITHEPGKNWPFSWAPDSDRIVYAGFHDGCWNLYSVSRSTRVIEPLTDMHALNGFVRYPSWSPDGRLILFERTETVGNIFVADLASDAVPGS